MLSSKLTEEQKTEIIQKFQEGKTKSQLQREYFVSWDIINRILAKNNLGLNCSRRKYSLNQDFFDNIDSEEKAYFLGLLYADGCNYVKNNQIIIALQETDKDILEKLNKIINSNRPLGYAKKTGNRKNQYILYLYSKKISKRLCELGCGPAKSLNLKFPSEKQVPSNLINHFMRGFFDGDGYIGTYKTKYNTNVFRLNFSASSDFVEEFSNVINYKFNYKPYIANINRVKGFKTCTIQKKSLYEQISDWMYEDSNIYMNRKYNIYVENKQILIQERIK